MAQTEALHGQPPPTCAPSSPPPATLAAPDGSAHGTLGTGVIGGSALCVTSFSCTWIIYNYLKADSLKQSETSGVTSYSDKCHNESPRASSAWWWRRGAEPERAWASRGAPGANVAGVICVWQLSCSLNTSGAHPGKSSSDHRKQQRRQGRKQAGPRGHGPPPAPEYPEGGVLRAHVTEGLRRIDAPSFLTQWDISCSKNWLRNLLSVFLTSALKKKFLFYNSIFLNQNRYAFSQKHQIYFKGI